jgi:hypothetical protein
MQTHAMKFVGMEKITVKFSVMTEILLMEMAAHNFAKLNQALVVKEEIKQPKIYVLKSVEMDSILD